MRARNVISGAVLAALAVLLWAYAERNAREAVRPPPGGGDLTGFLELRANVGEIRHFVRDGRAYFMVVGQTPNHILALPSGPPAYIFDESGRLVDWTGDLGDAQSFVSKWGRPEAGTRITAERARHMVGNKGGSGVSYDEKR